MAAALGTQLPAPHLGLRAFGAQAIPLLTDDALFEQTGVRVAFSGRSGGVSEGPYATLNVGNHVGDAAACVEENRRRLLAALDASDVELVVPSQVHGDALVRIEARDAASLAAARTAACDGADGLVVSVPQVAALLCFADCVPVVIVSPRGCFAVVHAGWRGVMNGVAAKAVRAMASGDAAGLNVYIGPHIHVECFETGEDVRAGFVSRFGEACAPDARHVDLLEALRIGLCEVGVLRDRIVDAGVCTKCRPGEYFSYRAAGGVCGRHGALAFRKDR